ncbi:response regulator [Candidatus Parcubacteria bacterium]|nr:response regulator [Candidatus Parcubacteria bacterium]
MNNKQIPRVDFQVLFEAAPGLFLVLSANSPKFTIVAASEAYLKATMTRRNNIVGKRLFEVFPDNPSDPKATGTSNLRSSIERAIAQKKPDAMAVQKYDIQRPASKGGGFEIRYWSPLNTPILNKQGEVEYIIHRVEDVTDYVDLKQKDDEQAKIAENLRTRAGEMELEVYKRAQEIQKVNKQLQAANKKLNELDELKTQFFTNVSHEFRTPLTLMLSPLEQSLMDKNLPKQHLEQLQLIHRNALRLKKLVNNLLDLSSLEAGKLQSSFQPVEIGKFTKELASTFQSAMDDAKLTFKIHCPPLKKKVYVDSGHFEKIIFNLLSNALKYTLKGSVEVSARQNGKYAEIIVTDTGTGIPKDELTRLFERFHRVQNAKSRSIEGTGIGLALINELVKLHGGTISAKSISGKGTTFIVQIPFGSAHLPKDQVIKSDKPSHPNANGEHGTYLGEAQGWIEKPADELKAEIDKKRLVKSRWKETILVVDDNADMREYVQRILNDNTSLTIETANNGKMALQAIEKKMPSLIITDIMMPEMDGFEFVAKIRQNPAAIQVPIIFLSARAGERERVAGIAEGVDDYLTKPFTVNELLSHVYVRLNLATLRGKKQSGSSSK